MIAAMLKIKMLRIMLNKSIRLNERLAKNRKELCEKNGFKPSEMCKDDPYIYVNCGYKDCLAMLNYMDKMSLKELISYYYKFLKKEGS